MSKWQTGRRRFRSKAARFHVSLSIALLLGCNSDPTTRLPDEPAGEAEQPAARRTDAGEGTSQDVLLPPALLRDKLLVIPPPQLTTLADEVQQQLRNAQGSLGELTRQPDLASIPLSNAYGELGRLYHAYRLLDSAEACYRNAQKLQPDEFRWYHYLADVCRRKGQSEPALATLQAALELHPDDLPALVAQGEIYFEAGQLDPAERAFERAMQLQPNAAALVGLGKIALSRKDA